MASSESAITWTPGLITTRSGIVVSPVIVS